MFPAGEAVPSSPRLGTWDGESYMSWVFPLLPYLGEEGRAKQLAQVTSFQERHAGGTSSLYGTPIRCLVCPSDALPMSGAYEYCSPVQGTPTHHADFPLGRYDAVCSYGGNWGTQAFLNHPSQVLSKDGVFHYNTRTTLTDITDGSCHTILLGERSHLEPRWRSMGFKHPSQQDFVVYARWYTGGVFTGRQPHETVNYKLPGWVTNDPPKPGNPAWTDLYYKRLGSYGSEHPGGCNLAMADGAVRFVAQSIDLTTLQALSTKAGREVVLAD